MRIGFVIGRFGGVDGVALETEKWMAVLARMGHECFVLAGAFEDAIRDPDHRDLAPILAFDGPVCCWEQQEAFFAGHASEDAVLSRIEAHAQRIEVEVLDWILRRRLDLVIPENSTSLPFHLSTGIALSRLMAHAGIPFVLHQHDFWFERGDRYHSHHPGVNRLVEEHYPPRGDCRHAVINSWQQGELRRRYGVDALVVPNVMDFDVPYGLPTPQNAGLPVALGLSPSDIALFQVTRVVRRKGIEVALDLVHRLDDPRMKLVITGDETDDPGSVYFGELAAQLLSLGLDGRVIFAGHCIRHRGGPGTWNLSDAYAHSAACTYFSTYEGFGNAFVEAVAARRPVFVNRYEPVYWPDIGSKGFRTVMLTENRLTDAAVEEIREVLTTPALAAEIAAHNRAVGRRHFSFDVLERLLGDLLAEAPGSLRGSLSRSSARGW